MPARCVFLDRDRTLIEDPGYLTAPKAVKLLPGVDLALRSLAEAGFRLVVVTNQSGIARGILTEGQLETIHLELRRQLSERNAHLEAIYYCPYHPEGTVEQYARESVDRKPQPGMLLRAAKELDLDLAHSWMVGDSPRDVEAGQRAGCRTIRVRAAAGEGTEVPSKHDSETESPADEDSQADFTVRNLVDAARIIVRESAGAPAVGAGEVDAAGEKTAGPGPAERVSAAPLGQGPLATMTDSQLLREIAGQLRELNRAGREGAFSFAHLSGSVFQILALLALLWGAVHLPGITAGPDGDFRAAYDRQIVAHMAFLAAAVLQLTALTFFVLGRRR